jgi:hypothetical protein
MYHTMCQYYILTRQSISNTAGAAPRTSLTEQCSRMGALLTRQHKHCKKRQPIEAYSAPNSFRASSPGVLRADELLQAYHDDATG